MSEYMDRNIWVDVTYLSELRRDFLATIGITYTVFRIAKSRLRAFGAFCLNYNQNLPSGYYGYLIYSFT